jgi:hypothetical protein
MLNEFLNVIPKEILWAGYIYLGLLFLGILRTLLDTPYAFGDIFSESPGGSHHLARYALFFGSLVLSIKFLITILGADSAEQVNAAVEVFKKFNVGEAAGASSAAYLLAKVTNGQILTLFGRRRS